MNVPVLLAATAAAPVIKADHFNVITHATPEAKAIIAFLVVFSILAWSVMIGKALQMRRAKRLNLLFQKEYRTQKSVLDVYDRRFRPKVALSLSSIEPEASNWIPG